MSIRVYLIVEPGHIGFTGEARFLDGTLVYVVRSGNSADVRRVAAEWADSHNYEVVSEHFPRP